MKNMKGKKIEAFEHSESIFYAQNIRIFTRKAIILAGDICRNLKDMLAYRHV